MNTVILLWAFVVNLLCLLFVFPHIPGIAFEGTFGAALGLTLLEFVVCLALCFLVSLSLIAWPVFVIFKQERSLSKSEMAAWFCQFGFWKTVTYGFLISQVLNVLTWKITAGLSSNLTIHGWLPILIGSVIISVICWLPMYILGVASVKKFNEAVGKLTREAKLEDAAKGIKE